MPKHCLLLILLLLCTLSCSSVAPAPRDMATLPGPVVGKKPEADDPRAKVVSTEPGIVRPEASEIFRQLGEQNREFNERIRQAMAGPPQRLAAQEAVSPSDDAVGDAQPLSMNFYDADLVEVIRLFMSLLGADYILHPQVSGRVSLTVSDSFRPDQMLDLLAGILRINGMVMSNVDGILEIMPLARAPSLLPGGVVLFPEGGLSPRRGQMIQAFRLHFISATEMTTIIRPYLSEGAQVYAHDANGIMLVCDFPHSQSKIADLIAVFDESVFAEIRAATYFLEYVQAEDAAKELEEVAKTFGLGSDQPGVRARVSFLPLARLNTLLALTRDEQVLEFIDAWVRELDRELPVHIQEQYGQGVYVYYVQYGNASEIVASLQGLFEYVEPTDDEDRGRRFPSTAETPPADPARPGPEVLTAELPPLIRDAPFPTPVGDAASASGKLSGPVVFVVDEPNNAVLIRCSTVDYPKIMSIIEKLDQYPRQVLIEVLIAEVMLTEDMRLGMEWQMLGYRDGVHQNMSLDTGIGGIFIDPTGAASITSGLSYVVASTSRMRAALKASAQDGHVRVLSSPTLLASDNKPAVINIGEEVPIPTSRLTRHDDTDPNRRSTETTIQYRDTGIILKVTPKINKQGMVRMEISQEVSQVSSTPVPGVDAPRISTRHASTTVAVNDQQTIVIGGLIQQAQTENTTGVPGLSRIPLLKYLFGYERKQFENSELILFITPHVVIDEQDSTFITRDFLQRLNRIKAGMR
ncbi:type II secretion system secretin GspD [Desulfonatronum sp. SC1]|uniref:type II secretion system secretin GspD n=1 Tax=Desulfonatronum sp. SC1 TaxID=2109626 RepID=UPI000D310CB7|nr:type II secretion system secretin GspD [Desulfonatronum sp. SC1]PTN35136.1 type II secretion system protein GspD [Desulfonatronum sp. SC1]